MPTIIVLTITSLEIMVTGLTTIVTGIVITTSITKTGISILITGAIMIKERIKTTILTGKALNGISPKITHKEVVGQEGIITGQEDSKSNIYINHRVHLADGFFMKY
jgi:hypothetical protein